jgi:UDP-N-acetylmuramate--alanine ligase
MVDIHPAREKPIEGVTSKGIVEIAQKKKEGDFEYVGAKENAPSRAVEMARPGDVIITMGAGSVTLLKLKILEMLKKK